MTDQEQTFIELLRKNIQLGKFLPTPEEIEKMDEHEFTSWIERAAIEIPKRKVARNPLFHLKEQISQILADENKSEIEKEEAIYDRIRWYWKLILRQSE
ncbi:hypothetical protein TGS27_2793 [Geobacillus stearothermophilus]|uniref:Uncharacterized protein n=2 Tax=Geobacillus TaxID=129337 RepID=A0A1Q5STY0_9BACL|nr:MULTISPECIES: hypothetical protein [Geobacillus]KLR75302.1 hypothetical protein ABH20_01015 [Geobacillus sp. T6]KMY62991.1 hypothetical protein AA906_01140 [Geobacillus stearothermophilus]KMY63309.1 hypothetical protein AA904_03615 [Geobacillus stearothermophilus]KMY64642.1 hypothetical protein AA905_02585 [Geobacillus stearothermophilus]KQC48499.1 hypothetical protein AP057_12530 [Geobacillus sp. Sah69]